MSKDMLNLCTQNMEMCTCAIKIMLNEDLCRITHPRTPYNVALKKNDSAPGSDMREPSTLSGVRGRMTNTLINLIEIHMRNRLRKNRYVFFQY